jgi:hypothetical protein
VLIGLSDTDFTNLLGLSTAQIARVRTALGAAQGGAAAPTGVTKLPNIGSFPALRVPTLERKPGGDAGAASAGLPAAPTAAAPAASEKPHWLLSGKRPADEDRGGPPCDPAAALAAASLAPAPVVAPKAAAAKSAPLFADADSPPAFAAPKPKGAGSGPAPKPPALFADCGSDDDEASLFKPRASSQRAPLPAAAAPVRAAASRKPALFEDSDGEDGADAALPGTAAVQSAVTPDAQAPEVAAQGAPAPALRDAAPTTKSILDFGARRNPQCWHRRARACRTRLTPARSAFLAGGGIGETEEDAREQALFASASVRHTVDAQKHLESLRDAAQEAEKDADELDAGFAALGPSSLKPASAAPAAAQSAAPAVPVNASQRLFDDDPEEVRSSGTR